MKRRLITVGIIVLIISLLSVCGLMAHAAQEGEFIRRPTVTGITVTVGENSISNIYSDPVEYSDVASNGYLTGYDIILLPVGANDSVIYTAYYPNTTTGRTGNVVEYTCEYVDGKYVVTAINTSGDGSTYIPVGGFVLSLNASTHASFAKLGDAVALSYAQAGTTLSIPEKAVESTNGKRVVVDATNTNRSNTMVYYYDYQFGEKTGTNVFGTEMICQFDFEKNTFVVKGFRAFGVGDASGSEIPDNGFVLSAYGAGWRQLLCIDQLFKVGDEVKMVGFDFVRFGGTVSGSFDYINPTKESNPDAMETATEEFPAFRGTDQTIIYKHGWSYKGSVGTGTNVYGFEAAVDANGVVVELGVNVSTIPEGGYVISGHGIGRDFIRGNMVLGATVVLDEAAGKYYVSTTLNSYYENLVTSVQNAINSAETRVKQLYDVDAGKISELVTQLNDELLILKGVKEDIEEALEAPDLTEETRLNLLMSYNDSQIYIEKLRRELIVSSADSKAVSARAVWHRPVEYSYAAIKQNVELYKEIGINLIFVETLYNGYSTFRTDVEEFPYHNKLATSYVTDGGVVYDDYLSAFVACCVENGIEVHAWVENFYVGTERSAKVLEMHPDWIMYNDDGTYLQRNEGGLYIFIDPANKEVQDTLIAYYNDLFTKHPEVSGLNLDYIRYPVSDASEDTGFTISAMKGFYELLGKSFSESQLSSREKMYKKFIQLFDSNYLIGGKAEADRNYAAWVEYRAGVVTEYVRRIKNEVKLPNDIMLSTSVFASLTESSNAKKQDWKTWFNNGWIDIATPMAYYNNSSDVNARVQEMILMGGNTCMYYTGLASSFSGLPAYYNKEFVEASYQAGAMGYVIFCSDQIIGHTDVQEALKSGVNSTWAVLPHADINDLLAASFASILDRADRLYIPASGMNAEKRDALKAVLDAIAEMDDSDAVSIYKIKSALVELTKTSNIKNYASGYSRQRILDELDYLIEIIDARMSMKLIEDGHWDPEVEPQRPNVDENGIGAPETNDPDPKPPVGGNDNNDNEPEPLGFFARIILAIINFFKKLFGIA